MYAHAYIRTVCAYVYNNSSVGQKLSSPDHGRSVHEKHTGPFSRIHQRVGVGVRRDDGGVEGREGGRGREGRRGGRGREGGRKEEGREGGMKEEGREGGEGESEGGRERREVGK